MVAAVVAAKEIRARARRSINLVNTREAMTASGAKRPVRACYEIAMISSS
jgi:hypothetical protein